MGNRKYSQDLTMKIDLILATEKDIPKYLSLEKSLPETKIYSGSKDEAEAKKEFEENIISFIRSSEEIVGSIQYEMKSPDHAYISGLVVSPQFQGQGIAREAMNQLLEKLKDVKVIDLVTHPENPVIHLYESLGFVRGETIENYFGDGEPRLRLSKQA